MAESSLQFLGELAERSGQGATGALDVRDGKRRWLFYLVDGALAATRSNLKSEQAEALQAKKPGLTGAALHRAQALRRMRTICRVAGAEWTFKDGSASKDASPADLPSLVVRVVGAESDAEALGVACAPVSEGFPAAVGDLSGLGVADPLAGYLQSLDGARPGADVIDFAPGERADVLGAIWAAWKLGLVVLGEGSASEVSSVAAAGAGATPPPSGGGGGGLDLSAMMAGVVSTPVDATPKPPPPPEKHPMEDALKSLAGRLASAESHFDVLGLPWNSDVEAFRKAHLVLAQQLHPDRYVDAADLLQDMATEAFDRVREAWEVLGNDEKRKAYIDHEVHGIKTEEELAMEQVENYWAAEAEFKRGLATFNAGRIGPSFAMFAAAVAKVPDEQEFRAYWAYTDFHSNRGRDPEAAERAVNVLKDVLEKNKEQERKLDSAWLLLGRIYRDTGEEKLARRCFVQALRINASNPDATREMRRLSGGEAGKSRSPDPKKGGAEEGGGKKKGGFFSGLFGKKKK